jgi:peptidase YpeB-like protein
MRKALLTLVFATALSGSLGVADSARAACDAGDKIDKTTVNDARQKIEAAGYRQVRQLTKGCDNFWHGSATKDGTMVYVVVSPQGKVMTEGPR